MTRQPSIKRNIMAVVMLTSVVALLLMAASFGIYDLLAFRSSTVRNLTTLAQAIANNSTATLAFRNEHDAREILSSLRVEPQVVAAVLYDADGKVFATYPNPPQASTPSSLPQTRAEHEFVKGLLVIREPVMQDGRPLGVLCLWADLRYFYSRLEVYSGVCGAIVLGSLAVALALSIWLQRRISDPLIALADTARIISDRRDYSVRAPKLSGDELGLLTDAFNQMLNRIQEQTQALREGEQRLQLALRASRTGAWNWDLATNRIVWDDFMHALYGLKPGEFQGTFEHSIALTHPADRAGLQRACQEAIEQRESLAVEFRVIWPDGSIHYLSGRGQAFYSPSGKALQMSGVTQDDTERRQAQEAVAFLAAIVNSSDDAIIGKDLNGNVVTWNLGAERMFGYTAAEMFGRQLDPIISPDRPDEEQRILERARKGETHLYETIRIRKDGQPVHISLTVSPILNAAGVIVGASSISRDISDRIRAQEALERQSRILAEQAQLLDLANVMARDLDDRIILWNTGMEKMYGWGRSEALGSNSHRLLKTRFPKPLREIQTTTLRDGKWEGELLHTRKDGKTVVVASLWVVHKDEQGHPAAILEVDADITDRKRAEQETLRMNSELEKRVKERTAELVAANHELEAFTYSVAHDLRAPLRHIDAFTRILAEDYSEALPVEGRRHLEIIRKGSQSMSHLIDDLLNLARVGRQELNSQPTPLSPIVHEIIAELKRETDGRHVEWRLNPLPTVSGDPGLLRQVFTNLLSNAVKYTRPRPHATIEIGIRRVDDQPVIYVNDNGVGFNMKYADKLFGVFQRLHRTDEFEGTGVGLAIVERVIRRHGGRIWAQAEVDKGATFYFTLHGLDNAGNSN